MISASAADAHRFGRVKRNGYDPAEVDAVVARLVDAVRKYEAKNDELQKRLSEADASADAIRRTFMAAESTRDALLDEARGDAGRIKAEALSEAESIIGEAEEVSSRTIDDARAESERMIADAKASAARTAELAQQVDAEVAAHRDRILREAYDEIDGLATRSEQAIAERSAAIAASCVAAREAADGELERARRVASARIRVAMIASARIRREAAVASAAIVEDARATANDTKRDAEVEADNARARADRLRHAIAELDGAAHELAQATAAGLSFIDLSTIEAAESDVAAIAARTASEKWAVRSPRVEATEVDEAPERPLLTVAEATAALEDENEDGDEEEAKTYYQRSTGTPLSERVKIARQSG